MYRIEQSSPKISSHFALDMFFVGRVWVENGFCSSRILMGYYLRFSSYSILKKNLSATSVGEQSVYVLEYNRMIV